MHRFSWLLLVGLSLLPGELAAEDPAGAVLYYRQGSEVYLLLADHSNGRGWAAYGGGASPGETVEETAARETEEETRGYFKKEMLLPLIQKETPQIHGAFHMYFLEVGYVPCQDLQKVKPPIGKSGYWERGPYAWIPYSEIKSHYVELMSSEAIIDERFLPAKRHSDYIWRLWLAQMWYMDESGVLPWLD